MEVSQGLKDHSPKKLLLPQFAYPSVQISLQLLLFFPLLYHLFQISLSWKILMEHLHNTLL